MGRPTFIDDNFGCYEIEDNSNVDFYFETQAQSVRKKCQGCGRMVKIKPEYAYCNSCAEKRERGMDF